MEVVNLDEILDKFPRVTSSRIFVGELYHPFGLFSEQIFGPVKDYECQCGNYSGLMYAGKRCPECGVLCDTSTLRGKSIAVIELPFRIPIPPIFLQRYKVPQDYEDDLTRYFIAKYLKIKPDEVTDEQYLQYSTKFIVVTPPLTRPILVEKDKEIVDSLNKEYAVIINQIQKYKEVDVPEFKNKLIEKLFETQLFKVITQKLTGKKGFIRKYLLGKRIPAGRTVATPDPYLRSDKVRIPFRIAAQIFAPLIVHELSEEYSAYEVFKACEDIYNNIKTPLASAIKGALQRIAQTHKVVINRQPTLHVSNIQAYNFEIWDGDTLQTSLIIDDPFNLDYDGDSVSNCTIKLYDQHGNIVYEGKIDDLIFNS